VLRQIPEMLKVVGADSLAQLVEETIPSALRSKTPLELASGKSESEVLGDLRELSKRNDVFRS